MGVELKRQIIKVLSILFILFFIISNSVVKGYALDEDYATRIYGQNRYETSLIIADALKEEIGTDKFNVIILASGKNYPDALAGSFLAVQAGAPIILVDDNHVSDVYNYISSNLSDSGSVFILGGTSAVSEYVEEYIGSDFETYRIDGATRYDTDLNILDVGAYATDDEDLSDFTVFVCSGNGYADSLSISSSGNPILLINPSKGLTNKQYNFLKENRASEFVVVGGTKSVPKSVESKLNTLGNVERIAGASRYETSAMLAEYYSDYPTVVLAYGGNFPDGLCAGPLACFSGGNLILCDNKNIYYAQQYVEENYVDRGYVIGGPNLISNGSARRIFDCSTIAYY